MTLSTTSACVGGRHVSAFAAAMPRIALAPKTAAEPVSVFAKLSPRERQVVASYVITGTAKGVAKDLGMSVGTSTVHLVNARTKCGISNLVLLAVAFDRETRGAA